MPAASRHVSVRIERPFAEVYDYVSDPANVAQWAQGLANAPMEPAGDGSWVADSPMGRVKVAFAPPNAFGVVDHDVTLPSGETVHNPFRLIPDGPATEALFTVRRRPGMSEADLDADAAAVLADLTALKRLLEQVG